MKPLSPPGNTGDGLAMALDAGAAVANMNSYWGQPVMFDPSITRDGEPVAQFESGRGEPGSLIVNRAGLRFANEALPYNDFPRAFGRFDPTTVSFPNEGPAWMIFDRFSRCRVNFTIQISGQLFIDRCIGLIGLALAIHTSPHSRLTSSKLTLHQLREDVFASL